MGLIIEPENIDLIVKSEPWTEEELADFRELIKKQKAMRAKKKSRNPRKKINTEKE